ncbi:MAG: FISUMP domain-containing protein [Candidatus Gracilibacteria bacterium]|nr:FISUMP domain-containing protein [Candidatus Gracilibacteria bacterium]
MKTLKNTSSVIASEAKQSRSNISSFSRKLSGFTLVELIVVITILVILGTIAFTSLTGFSGNARDSDRVTTLKNIESGLDLFQIKSGQYPTPENITGTGTVNGNILASVGEIGDTISRIIKINKIPTDPLSKSNYVYGTNTSKTQYQIATTLENAVAHNSPFISQTYAANSSLQARVNGNYSGYIKFSSGSETWIANIPSLIFNNTGSTNLLSTGTYFVVNKQQNLPYKLDDKTETRNKNATEIIQAIANTTTATLTGARIDNITTSTGVSAFFTGALLASFGGNITFIETAVLGKTATITPPAPNDCTFNSSPVTHATAVTAYLASSVSFGNTCTSEQRTCTNGTLSGTYTFAACTVAGATGTFTLSQTSVTQGTNPTISNNCSTAPTGYTSSDTAVATIAGTTITTLSAGTTDITPVGGACADNIAKTLTVIAPVINGTCGTANNLLTSTSPTATRCSTGDPTIVTDTGTGWTWSCNGSNGGTTASCNAPQSYPNCNIANIKLANNQVWSACNVGATTAYVGESIANCAGSANDCDLALRSTLGGYYQWGRNNNVASQGTPTATQAIAGTLAGGVGHSNFITNATSPYDWIATQNDNLWGGAGTTSTAGTFASQGSPATMQGPCPTSYHVPTQFEWCSAAQSINPALTCTSAWQNDTSIATTLKLPLSGSRYYSPAGYFNQGVYGYYWSSSPSGIYGYYVTISGTQVYPLDINYRAYGFSVRCLKN